MAMILKSEPPKNAPAHNDLFFVVASDNTLNINYKYICDVYINAVRIARLKNNPNPNFDYYGIFNVNKIMQSYVNSDYFTAPATVANVSAKTAYVIKISERYEASGSEVANNDVIVSDTKYAYNSAFPYMQSAFFLEDAVTDNNLLLRRFVTDRPSQISVPSLADFFITGYTTTPDQTTTFQIIITTYTGFSQTGTSSVSTHPGTVTKDNDFILNAGTQGLTNAGISLTGINSYKVELKIDGTTVTSTLLFNIDLCSPKYEVNHFVFMNKLGGFESVYFNKVSKKSVEIDRKVMQAQGTKFNGTTFKLDTKDSNNVFYEAQKGFATRYTEKLKVNTDWLSDEQYTWMLDLLTSPVIFMQQTLPASIGISTQTVYVPCRITNKDFEIRKKINQKLSQVELEFDLGYNNYTQFR